MRDRAELKPRIAKIFEKFTAMQGQQVDFSLATIFTHAEDEVAEICRLSCDLGDLDWDDLDWEDVPVIAQAVWELNIITEAGGGLVGKTAGLLAPMLSSPQKTESAPSGPDSVSSPADGEAAPSDSSTS